MGGPLRIKSETLKVKVWPVLTAAVETGLLLGWNRAHKHTPTPTPEAIREAQEQAIMFEIGERVTVEDDW